MKRLFLILAVLCAPAAFAQSYYNNRVQLASGLAYPNATVTVCNAGSSGIPCSPVLQTYVADAFGNYTVVITAGTYDISVSGSGISGFKYTQTIGGTGGGGGGSGTVTSVGLQINGAGSSGIFAVTGSPITGLGSLNYNLTGTPGGLLYFSDGVTVSSSNALTLNLPILGGGAGGAPVSGSITGNTTKFATFTGPATASRCIDTDAFGNEQVTAADCGTGGSGVTLQTNGVNNSSQTTLNLQNAGVFTWTSAALGVESVNFASESANFFLAAPNGSSGVPTARAMVAADVPAGTACGGNNFSRGLNAALASICNQPAFSNLIGTILLGQTALTTNGDILSVTGGALARIASAGGQDFFLQGANAAAPTWGALVGCGDATHACAYSTITHLWSNVAITVGTGTIDNALQYAGAYYFGSGSNNVINGVAAPTTPNVPFLWCSTPSGGNATAPTWCEPGVPINAQTGTSYTELIGDRENLITTSNTGATAHTLPQAGTTGFDHNFNFALSNINTGLVTITPTTSTINGNATQLVADNWTAFIYSDNSNYFATVVPSFAAFGSTCTKALQWSTVTGALSCGNISLTAAVSGTLAQANGGTGATTQQAALNALAPTPTNPGDLIYYNGTNWVDFAGNTSGTQFLEESSIGVPSWAANSTTVTLDAIQAAAGANTLANGDNAQVWNWALTTSGKSAFTFGETTAATSAGTPFLVNIQTKASSTANPLVVTAVGTANGLEVTKAAVIEAIGSGAFAIGATAHTVMLSEGATTAVALTAVGGTNFPLIGQSASDPIWSTIGYPTSAVSGGVICATSTTQLASSAILITTGVMEGGGAGSCPATTVTPVLGTDNSTAGTVQLANGSAAAHTIFSSGATTTNTIAGFTAVATTHHLVACEVSSTTCTLTDSGITDASPTGTGAIVLANTPTLITPVIGAATGTSLLASGIVDGKAPIAVTTGTSSTLGAATYQSGYTFNQEATAGTGVTYTLPATATGLQYCVANSIVSGTGAADTGVLTVYPPSSSYVILNGVRNTIGGGGTHGVASAGAAGDAACFVAIDSTDWTVYVQKGTWTAN